MTKKLKKKWLENFCAEMNKKLLCFSNLNEGESNLKQKIILGGNRQIRLETKNNLMIAHICYLAKKFQNFVTRFKREEAADNIAAPELSIPSTLIRLFILFMFSLTILGKSKAHYSESNTE